MLSLFRSGALRGAFQGHGIVKVMSAVPARGEKTFTREERIEQWDYVNSVYFGPERDMKNFPTLVQADSPEPVRLGVIPARWFDFLYPKTGVSGPYVLLGGFTLWMMSKEIMVIDHYFWEFPSFWGMVYILNKHPKVGPKLKKWLADSYETQKNIFYTRPLKSMKDQEADNIARNERLIEETETAKHIYLAQKEGVQLQLEAAYRQRLQNAFLDVKKRLDYEVEKTNVRRKFEQDHMVNWIVSSVTKSISPQLEKESIKVCIQTLKGLASKQKVAVA
ncbi:unnamed protein product [Lymnaea stagnalis]|uniref:ATP synthase subunit b n=1 Tax=Lymnaea stagnalis TaxID=6523 RepID=A0AAV2I3U8_LYMST